MRFGEINNAEDRTNLTLHKAVVDGNVMEGTCSHKPGADIEPCRYKEFQGKLEKVRSDRKRGTAVLTEESWDVKEEEGSYR